MEIGTSLEAPSLALPVAARWRRVLAYFGYGAGAFGACAAIFPTGSLILYFLTDRIGLSVGLATLAIAIPKVWDVLVDPVIGEFCDRLSRRTGSRFSAFALASVALPVSAASVFLVHWAPGVVTTICVTVLLIAMSTFYTVYWVTHLAAANDIDAADRASRNALLVVRMVGQSAGGLFAGAVAPLLLGASFFFSGYVLMAICLGAIGIAAMAACALTLRPIRTAGVSMAPQKVNLVIACRNAVARPRALGLILSNFSVMVACTYLGTMLPYVNKYLLHFDDAQLAFSFTAVMAAQVFGAVVGTWVARRLGAERGFMAASLGLLVSGLGFFFGSGHFPMLLFFLVGWGTATGAYTVLLHGSLLDASRASATIGAATGLLLGLLFAVGKVGDTAGSLLAAASLTSSGGIAMLQHSPDAAFILKLWFGIVPSGLVALGIMIAMLANRFTARA